MYSSKPLPSLKGEETALLVIDMQNDFVKPDGYVGRSGKDVRPVLEIIPKISRALDFSRKIGMPRIFVKTIHADYTNSDVWGSRYGGREAPPLCVPGTWGSEIIDELRPLEGEPIVIKHRYSAMLDTDLPLILRSKKIRNLAVTGNMTNACIDSTVRHAFMMDYLTITLSDCVATPDTDLHEPTLKNLARYFGYVCTLDEFINSVIYLTRTEQANHRRT
ncbi:MAG: cysteine hydrolase [Aigarchaeota archaeon]|nr:cysteine hydrolase [Aigarchaeota archaeon]MDW8092911.1 cysteine hydrolase [Nitrososphaerota archaeon]